MVEQLKARRFEQAIMPHLDAAYNLARWLTRSDSDAEDVVQEACLRAYKYFDGFEGDNPAAWLLAIVRNTCFTWLKANRPAQEVGDVDSLAEEMSAEAAAPWSGTSRAFSADPETLVIEGRDKARLNALIAELPAVFREVIVLREIEDLSYREIAAIAGVPIGTVMSRLARARKLLHDTWHRPKGRE